MNVLNSSIFENLVSLRTKMQEKGNAPLACLYHWQALATLSGICFELDQDILLKNDYMDLLLKGASKRLSSGYENWLVTSVNICLSPNFFIEYLTQNVIFHVKSHVTKHVFWGLHINTKITTSHVTKLDMKWNMKWYIFIKFRWVSVECS